MKESVTNAIPETAAERKQWSAPTLKILSTEQTKGGAINDFTETATKRISN